MVTVLVELRVFWLRGAGEDRSIPQSSWVREVVSEGDDSNHNASRLCNFVLGFFIKCEVRQGPAGMLKNGSILGVCFHDFKRGLS